MPPKAPEQDNFIKALSAPPRDSDEYRRLNARVADIAVKRGMDYIFEKYNLDAALFITEFELSYVIVGAAGYALVCHQLTTGSR